MRQPPKKFLIQLAAAILIFLFLYTSLLKILQPVAFISKLSHLPLLNEMHKSLLWLLPISELMVVILLCFPRYRELGFLLGLTLLLFFTVYIIGLYIFADRMPCSCGGILENMSWPQHIAFNMVSMVISFWGWWHESSKRFIAINRQSRNPV